MAIDYKSSGVDIEKGEELVGWLQDEGLTPAPHQDRVVDGIGGFASIFSMNFPELKDPCLVSATDGVGTKLMLAIQMDDYSGIGQDLVAMCANDLICTGAQPLFFLDYFATSKLDMKQAQEFLKGVREACHQAQMALIGGETAEMPGLYKPKEFDCAGFAVGVVDRSQILGPKNVKVGDQVIGVSSSGFHSNGFSLLRKLYSTDQDLKDHGRALLKPTALYINLAMSLLKSTPISALAHITGGGIHNISRVLPENLGFHLKPWKFNDLTQETMKRAEISHQEMLKTFNCGVGLAIIAPKEHSQAIHQEIENSGFESFDLGVIEEMSESIEIPAEWP